LYHDHHDTYQIIIGEHNDLKDLKKGENCVIALELGKLPEEIVM
jgi:hypothetical protein